jgi:3-oxoacyl-[acyl-carrier protein] reductase
MTEDRQVVVSGGGTGIGRRVAELFVEQGCAVTVLGRRADVLRRTADEIGARAVVCDLADPASVEAAGAELPRTVDVLVCNAGGNTDLDRDATGSLADLADGWTANWRANVLTAVLLTAAVAPRLGDGGRVVAIGSIAAHQAAGSYGAAKAALESWALDAATDLGPRGATVNVVAPGLTEGTEFFRGRLTDERRDRLVGRTLTGRAGRTDDVARTVVWLASPEAAHVTGQVVHVNGGAFAGR